MSHSESFSCIPFGWSYALLPSNPPLPRWHNLSDIILLYTLGFQKCRISTRQPSGSTDAGPRKNTSASLKVPIAKCRSPHLRQELEEDRTGHRDPHWLTDTLPRTEVLPQNAPKHCWGVRRAGLRRGTAGLGRRAHPHLKVGFRQWQSARGRLLLPGPDVSWC